MTHISSIATLRLLRSGDRLFAHWWTQTRPSSLTSWVGSLMGTHGHFDLSSTAKITTGPSANIFTNREYENMIRSLNLRRLSFVLFIGERNHFLAQLPSIQEKLVEILKNPPGAAVQSEVSTTSTHNHQYNLTVIEVYLCMRVLMCRLSPHNLSSFWPTILTELVCIFLDD